MRLEVRLQVVLLCESLIAPREGAHKWSLARVRAHVRAKVEVEGEALTAALKRAQVRALARVRERVPLEL